MRSHFLDPTLAQHHHRIRIREGREAVRAHHDRDALFERSVRTERMTERRDDAGLRADVNGGERVIQHEQSRIAGRSRGDGARKTYSLALAAGDTDTQLADFGASAAAAPSGASATFSRSEPENNNEF